MLSFIQLRIIRKVDFTTVLNGFRSCSVKVDLHALNVPQLAVVTCTAKRTTMHVISSGWIPTQQTHTCKPVQFFYFSLLCGCKKIFFHVKMGLFVCFTVCLSVTGEAW